MPRTEVAAMKLSGPAPITHLPHRAALRTRQHPLALPGARRLLALLAVCIAAILLPRVGAAQEATLDKWPSERASDPAALQRGARLFVNYCLNCHGASQMRWNRLRDIGLDETQIKAQLIFSGQKVGEMMTVAMNPRDAKVWFGKAPPDLSVIIRARNTEEHHGTDYVYTLLRSFYRDRSTLTGWNNAVYPNIAMPNILWQRQGPRVATITRTEWEEHPAADAKQGSVRELVKSVNVFDADGYLQTTKAVLADGTPGTSVSYEPSDPKAAAAVDDEVADLVAFLNWMSEPGAATRYRIGIWVMGFLVIFLLCVRWLNKVYWRDIT
jgi:ubiquinol-cytochrome c reductase cytochrome c1 subunit